MTTELKDTEIVTDPVRLAFPALWVPKPVNRLKPDEVKYQATLLIPPDYNMAAFVKCIKAAMIAKWGREIKFAQGKNPLKKCNDRDSEKPLAGYDEDWLFINTKTDYQPTVIDKAAQPIIDPERVFAGCWCRFHLNAYGWEHATGGRGVSFGLNSVQLVKEDERLGGRKDAREVFGEIDVADFGIEDFGTEDLGTENLEANEGGGLDDFLN